MRNKKTRLQANNGFNSDEASNLTLAAWLGPKIIILRRQGSGILNAKSCPRLGSEDREHFGLTNYKPCRQRRGVGVPMDITAGVENGATVTREIVAVTKGAIY